jgi:hypothetical protein
VGDIMKRWLSASLVFLAGFIVLLGFVCLVLVA